MYLLGAGAWPPPPSSRYLPMTRWVSLELPASSIRTTASPSEGCRPLRVAAACYLSARITASWAREGSSVGRAVAVPVRRPGLGAQNSNLKFKGNGKLFKFKQCCFFQSRSQEELNDLFQVRAQWLQGSPWQWVSLSICTDRGTGPWAQGQGSPCGQGSPGNYPQNQDWACLGSEIQTGSAPYVLHASACEQNLCPSPKSSIPLVHSGSLWWGGHHSPLCAPLCLVVSTVHTPQVSRVGSEGPEWLEQPDLGTCLRGSSGERW